jgi:hypothetical protein
LTHEAWLALSPRSVPQEVGRKWLGVRRSKRDTNRHCALQRAVSEWAGGDDPVKAKAGILQAAHA